MPRLFLGDGIDRFLVGEPAPIPVTLSSMKPQSQVLPRPRRHTITPTFHSVRFEVPVVCLPKPVRDETRSTACLASPRLPVSAPGAIEAQFGSAAGAAEELAMEVTVRSIASR